MESTFPNTFRVLPVLVTGQRNYQYGAGYHDIVFTTICDQNIESQFKKKGYSRGDLLPGVYLRGC